MNKELSKEETSEKELLEKFAETIAPILFDPLMERDWETAKKCVEITQEYAEKENKELKDKVTELETVIAKLSRKILNKSNY